MKQVSIVKISYFDLFNNFIRNVGVSEYMVLNHISGFTVFLEIGYL